MSTASKNAFMESSHDLMDVWFRGMKQWQKKTTDTSDENAYNFVSEWAEKQQEFLSTIIGYDNPEELQQQAPKHFQNWLQIQNDFANQWMKKQEEVLGTPFSEEHQKQLHQMAESWQSNYQQWEMLLVDNMKKMQGELESKMPTEMLSSFRSFGKTYNHFFEHWESLLQLMQTANQAEKFLKTWKKNAGYNELVNCMMGFESTNHLKELMVGFNKSLEQYFSKVEEIQKDPLAYGLNHSKQFGGEFRGAWQQLVNLSTALQKQLQQTIAPFSQLEDHTYSIKVENVLKNIQEDYNAFLSKTIDLQHTVYQAAENALEETVEAYQKVLKGEENPSYNTFFSTWTEIVEKHLLQLFESETYVASQNELISMSANIKKRFNEVIEKTGNDLPFAWRSEVDELIQEIQQLKRKVASMERKKTAKAAK